MKTEILLSGFIDEIEKEAFVKKLFSPIAKKIGKDVSKKSIGHDLKRSIGNLAMTGSIAGGLAGGGILYGEIKHRSFDPGTRSFY